VTKRETGEAARQVPAVAAAIVDFLNSRPHATPTLPDTLASPGDTMLALRPFSTQSELAPSDDDLRRARELRSDLMAVVAPSGGAAEREAWGRLSQHAAAAPFRYAFPGGEVHVEPADGNTLTGRIISFVAELISSGNWSRIKACDNPACSHVFYDTTRSRTQRWDSYEVCGNRVNVAAYRARRARDGRPA
jgi:predicted RNA-binding Zn ribbon-like protein